VPDFAEEGELFYASPFTVDRTVPDKRTVDTSEAGLQGQEEAMESEEEDSDE